VGGKILALRMVTSSSCFLEVDLRKFLLSLAIVVCVSATVWHSWPNSVAIAPVSADYAAHRFAPFDDINRATVGALRVVCSYQMPWMPSFQSSPLVLGRTLVITTPTHTRAIDGSTCEERWRFDRSNQARGRPANRGAAFLDRRIFRVTPDGHLLALDAGTGRLIWMVAAADPDSGETLTLPPIAAESTIVIGVAGIDDGEHGRLTAFRSADGTRLWDFFVARRGGPVWTRMAYDTSTGVVYAATGNASPDFAPDLRAEPTPYANAVLALTLATGKLRWSRQFDSTDTHDYDLTVVGPIVGDTLIVGGKDGVVRALDANTGAEFWSTEVVRRENVDAPVRPEGTHACPGTFGGISWNGPAVLDSTLYVGVVEMCGRYFRDITIPSLAGYFRPDSAGTGAVVAVDLHTGKIRWRYATRSPVVASVLATAGGLLFAAEIDGTLYALDALSGARLWHHTVPGTIGGGIASYEIEGRQYVALTSGAASMILPSAHRGVPSVTIFSVRR